MIHILSDGPLDIATGRSRKELNWKNKEMQWSEIVEKLSVTHRTAEKYSEYLASKKSRQDEIKDIGGFVGGYLTQGRRKAGSVMHRQLITLDIDHGNAPVWDDYAMTYDNAALIYSTHKHSPDSPRLRLLIPLDRPVFTDEYVAISRKIAGILGIDHFDDTTFEPSRLMYWPSTAADGEFVFQYQDGPWLSADEVLASYHDWKDSSEWPVSSRSHDIIQREIKKQGDPLEKPRLIGAFCRTYSISEVIDKFLNEVYSSCDVPGRYTYNEGSTAAGLITYDDKYAYSHHGTDPVSGKLCNAFDLVRLHKFGLKDEDAREGTPGNKLPSYTSMVEFAAKDSAVKKQLGVEMIADAAEDFKSVSPEELENDEWLAQLDHDSKGKINTTINNIIVILNNDPNLKKAFSTNSFLKKEFVNRDVPWRKVKSGDNYFTDVDLMGLRNYLEKIYDLSNNQKMSDAIGLVLHQHSFHPVRDYLETLTWDGEYRIDTLLIDYLGAKDSAYTRAVTRKTLVAAIARIMRPGIKFDYVLTIVGKQGAGKSTLIKQLGREWYCENLTTVQGKEASEQLHGVWLMEMGELAGLKKAEVEIIKNFISRQEDSYRPAYASKKETYPRQCIFIGTTNNRDFLRDPTGNRRFWPVDTHETAPTKNLHDDLTSSEINQIWAEALELYHEGETLYLSEDLEAQANIMQMDHAEMDDRTGAVEKYLDTLVPENWTEMNIYDRRSFLQGDELQGEGTVIRDQVCIPEICCEALGHSLKELNTQNTKSVHQIMQNMAGWSRLKATRKYSNYGYQKGYFRIKKPTNSIDKFNQFNKNKEN